MTDTAEWRQVRAYLQKHRHKLSASAAARYPAADRAEGTTLLTTPSWLPAAPLPLDAVQLSQLTPVTAAPGGGTSGRTALDGAGPGRAGPGRATPDAAAWDAAVAAVLPGRADGSHYRRYSAAVAGLAAPAIFEDRRTYRLASAELAGTNPAGPRGSLAFERGTFFQGYDVGAAVAHEHAAAVLGVLDREDLRALVGDPRDLARRPANLAISTLTLRADGAAATFPLHWRDPAKVGHAGGLYQVVPVGIFQAADDGPASQAQDFDLWRGMMREFAEELLGTPEDYGPAGTAVDYRAWPFARQLTGARDDGAVRPWVLGLGVDPLTLATDLLTAVVIDAPVFDELFGAMVSSNAEGRIRPGLAFTAETVGRLTTREPMQAAGAALLRLAWRHRAILLPG
ncbi:MAG TPA: hypothetical protein VK586_01435 [Streptosporangiaceae bacterium]|nr:hypothetical protein [Streptosporangiaceae bacterium]